MAGELINVISNTTIPTDGFLDIKPPSGQEWIISNVNHGNTTIEIYQHDGTNSILVDTLTGSATGGSLGGESLKCTNTNYYRIKNKSVASFIGYDGIRSL